MSELHLTPPMYHSLDGQKMKPQPRQARRLEDRERARKQKKLLRKYPDIKQSH